MLRPSPNHMTLWQRTAQDGLTWRRHAEAFAQPHDTIGGGMLRPSPNHGTQWQRTAQDELTWRRHAEAFAQPHDTMAEDCARWANLEAACCGLRPTTIHNGRGLRKMG